MDLTLAIDTPISLSVSPVPRGGRRALQFIALLIFIAAGIFATRGAWEDIIHVATRDEEASHIWLVPFLAAWLAWVRRKNLAGLNPAPSVTGPILVGLGWWIGHMGFYGARQSPWHLGALLVAIGCAMTLLGMRIFQAIWPAVLVLLFVIPVPGMVRQQISIPLERATAWLTGGLLGIGGFPIVRSGNVITINGTPVTVAEACNGLRMVFPLFLIVYVFCFMLPLRTWLRVL